MHPECILPGSGEPAAAIADPGSGKRSDRRRPRVSFPADFVLDDELRAYAVKQGLGADYQFERFKNHALQNDRRCAGLLGWRAAFRNWCLSPLARAAESRNGKARGPETRYTTEEVMEGERRSQEKADRRRAEREAAAAAQRNGGVGR